MLCFHMTNIFTNSLITSSRYVRYLAIHEILISPCIYREIWSPMASSSQKVANASITRQECVIFGKRRL